MKRKDLLLLGGTTAVLAACGGGGLNSLPHGGGDYVRSTKTGALLINAQGRPYAELHLAAVPYDVVATVTRIPYSGSHLVYDTKMAGQSQTLGQGFILTTTPDGGGVVSSQTRMMAVVASVFKDGEEWVFNATAPGWDRVRVPAPRTPQITSVCSALATEWNWAFALLLIAGAIWAAEPLDPLAAAAFTAETVNLQRIQNALRADGCSR